MNNAIAIFNSNVEDGAFYYRAPEGSDAWKERVYFFVRADSQFDVGSKLIVGDANREYTAFEFEVIGCVNHSEGYYNVTASR